MLKGTDKGLSGGTIASVVITGIVVVFIGLILLIICVSIYGKSFDAVNRRKDAKAKAEAEKVQNAQVETVTDNNGLEAVKVTFDSGILFATGKSDLSATAKNSLAQFASVLKNNADCDIAIQGYTDNQGFRGKSAAESSAMNQALSLDRAAAVSNYLKGLAVSSSQIKSVEGFGEANPVADNSTAAGQAQNRRVEVYMYASQKMIQEAQSQAN
jgi:outer membrane protein OmpA-like peptidoglycan-associated protein